MRPLIGIPCRAGMRAKTEKLIYFSNRSYVQAVEYAGGVPVLIPLLEDVESLDSLLIHLDGLLLSGGLDIHPSQYQDEAHELLGETDANLDKLELMLARWAWRNDIPTLGICRGMQLLNVSLGGKLYQDLDSEYSREIQHANWGSPNEKLVHLVKIEQGSRMQEALGTDEVFTNSFHHQAVKAPGKGVVISGYAEDGVAETLEVPSRRFMLAVQCHPEELYKGQAAWARLFKAFVAACEESKSVLTVPVASSVQAVRESA
jgi:putative glutamine amidotransferase